MLQPSSAPIAGRASTRPAPAPARSSAALARRRRALLQLARRHGEVRLRVTDGGRPAPGAAEVSELLDLLNEDGLLRWGGLHAVEGGRELLYLAA